ncbi:unnamed protein product [Soboliphyme baturini]|uniref:DUF295 domain-containing protein n=1 Tax=Soboliphyme baturini TaxID=241478 RepID=A0A183INY1_9BILA|nr:unnamed protein product [Soboliphyme baturini]
MTNRSEVHKAYHFPVLQPLSFASLISRRLPVFDVSFFCVEYANKHVRCAQSRQRSSNVRPVGVRFFLRSPKPHSEPFLYERTVVPSRQLLAFDYVSSRRRFLRPLHPVPLLLLPAKQLFYCCDYTSGVWWLELCSDHRSVLVESDRPVMTTGLSLSSWHRTLRYGGRWGGP